jgi:hypothetical protein
MLQDERGPRSSQEPAMDDVLGSWLHSLSEFAARAVFVLGPDRAAVNDRRVESGALSLVRIDARAHMLRTWPAGETQRLKRLCGGIALAWPDNPDMMLDRARP